MQHWQAVYNGLFISGTLIPPIETVSSVSELDVHNVVLFVLCFTKVRPVGGKWAITGVYQVSGDLCQGLQGGKRCYVLVLY